MKNFVLILTLLFSFSCFSQKEDYIDLKAFYSTAIKNKIDYTKKKDHYYFFTDDSMNNYLPENIDGHKVNYINIYHKKNKKLLKKGIFVFKISPIRIKGNRILIYITDFGISRRNKKHYDFANAGGSITTFEYSCTTNKWEFIGTKHHGI
ncbi:hypothetical protein [Aquimarina megaterium]|uniref:hypothetical protein n=1 Tax=Aquimarina megaterium TaxID=1443666 RepID=UPI0004B86C0C|nr:hypothetical protein [Aquimarina megaterium]